MGSFADLRGLAMKANILLTQALAIEKSFSEAYFSIMVLVV